MGENGCMRKNERRVTPARYVTDLFVDWHSTTNGEPGTPPGTDKVIQWMLRTHNTRHQELAANWQRLESGLCRTHLNMHWAR